jgi:hypothetical protein
MTHRESQFRAQSDLLNTVATLYVPTARQHDAQSQQQRERELNAETTTMLSMTIEGNV